MDKKKKIILGAGAAGIAVTGGTLALFIADDSATVNTKVGTVDIVADATITHTQMKRDVMAKWLWNQSHSSGDVDAFGIYPNTDADTGKPLKESLTQAREELMEKLESAPENLNPGDNSIDSYAYKDQMEYPGTDHEINISIENKGNKSIETRVLLEISGNTADGRELTEAELSPIYAAFDPYNSFSGITSIHNNKYDQYLRYQNLPKVNVDKQFDQPTITYMLSKEEFNNDDLWFTDLSREFYEMQAPSDIIKSQFILSGTGTDSEKEKYALSVFKGTDQIYNSDIDNWYYNSSGETEIKTYECPTSGTFKIDLCVDRNLYTDSDVNLINTLQGSTIKIKVIVQALQYRNTSDATWQDVYEEVSYIQGPS